MAIIFIPGIKGSKLINVYPTDFEVRWSLEDMVVGDIFENPIDFELKKGIYDKEDFMLFKEWELINYAYEKMIRHIRKEVDPHLYTFPYDWRKPLELGAKRLVEFIDYIKGKLNKDNQEPRINFITHSMGGLLLRSALELRGPGAFDDIDRIAFIAPPFRGSCDIPLNLIAGEKNGWFSDEEAFRKLARSFPAVYQLIPSFENAAVSSTSGNNLDLFDVNNWQENVANSNDFHPDLLINAEKFIRNASAQHGGQSNAPMASDNKLRANANKILILLGVGHKTVKQIPVIQNNQNNRNWFDFNNSLTDTYGDGRVLLKSAAIRGISLAAYKGTNEHGTVCRDHIIIKSVEVWLKRNKLYKMTPRTPRNSVNRPGKNFFDVWDGNASKASFNKHIVG